MTMIYIISCSCLIKYSVSEMPERYRSPEMIIKKSVGTAVAVDSHTF